VDGGGYYTVASNWNAARAIPFLLADFGHVDYFALRGGFQGLPLRLADDFRKAGGAVHTGHRLTRLDLVRRGEPLIRLHFRTGPADESAVLARHVVLAMPRRAIELLDPDSFLFAGAQFQADLRTVLAQPALKLFSCYPEPWWQALGISSGRSRTDLPVRQCYYWGTEGLQPGADPRARQSILMASYNDGAAAEFWSGLGRTEPPDRPALSWSGHNEQEIRKGLRVPDQYRAPEVMVSEMQRQLKEVHGLDSIPEPLATVYKDWTQDPYAGGWHFWKTHARAEDVMPRIQHPITGGEPVRLRRSLVHAPGLGRGRPGNGRGRPDPAIRAADPVMVGPRAGDGVTQEGNDREAEVRHESDRETGDRS